MYARWGVLQFVKSYGEIATPLTKLLQKNAFKWDEEATTAFENLKLATTTIRVLALPDLVPTFYYWDWCFWCGFRDCDISKRPPYCFFQPETVSKSPNQIYLWTETYGCGTFGAKVETLPSWEEIHHNFKPKISQILVGTKRGSTPIPKMVDKAPRLWFWDIVSAWTPK